MALNLALDFINGSNTLDPRITFTRSTTATFTNSTGLIATAAINTPRFDYDPITLTPKGLLIEEQRTNLLTYSEQFDNPAWSATSNMGITANSTTAPDGTTTADTLVEAAATGVFYRGTNVAVTSGVTYTYSVYVKASAQSWVQLTSQSPAGGANVWANFDLTGNGAVGNKGTLAVNPTITNVGYGWYRCSVTGTATATTAAGGLVVWLTNNTNSATRGPSYTSAGGTQAVYVWGAQVEAGAFVTSYIPTVAAQVSRNADVATITGSNFTSFWNATQGGATVQALPSTVSGTHPLVQYDDGTSNEIITLRGNTTNPELYIVDGGTPQAQLDAGTIAANTAYSLTGWWATNDCKARKDSGTVVTDTTATIPTVTQMRIGSDGTNYLNGTIATIGYYDSFFGRPIYTRRKNKVFPSLL